MAHGRQQAVDGLAVVLVREAEEDVALGRDEHPEVRALAQAQGRLAQDRLRLPDRLHARLRRYSDGGQITSQPKPAPGTTSFAVDLTGFNEVVKCSTHLLIV